MKILFYTRNDFLTNTGGDTIQITKTKEYLEKLGVKIEILTDSAFHLNEFDLIHVFNVIPINPVYNFMKEHKHMKMALSPIYWNMEEYRKKVLDKVITKRIIYNFLNKIPLVKLATDSKNLAKLTGINTNGMFGEKLLFCLNSARILFPNSKAEQENIVNEFKLTNNIEIIPNGVDIKIEPESFINLKTKYNLPDEFILCVGRIEYRKNQLGLLKAASRLGVPVVLAGKISRQEKKYFSLLKDYKFIHIPSLSQSEIFGLYLGCKAHVLPSWFETPGLASLEAAYFGAQIVTTDRGCTKEYFEDSVFYCSPENTDSIENAIESALNSPKVTHKLQEKIVNNYTWEAAAKKTLAAYESVL